MILEALLLVGFSAIVLFNIRKLGAGSQKSVAEHHANPQIEQALAYAAKLYSERKYLAAEKAYLAVLKRDHKNHVAYTRLGKIYLALKNYPDAIECYRIASQLTPNAHTFFNLGSGYYENKNFVKAVAAFEKSIMFEASANRYVALAKAHQKLATWPKAINAYEKAAELQPDRAHLQLLYEAYRNNRRNEEAAAIQKRILRLAEPTTARHPHRLS